MQPVIARSPESSARRLKRKLDLAIHMFKHFPDKAHGVAILTSSRGANSAADNSANLGYLKQWLRGQGLGFRQVMGKGQEEGPDGQMTTVSEPSLVVPGITLEQAKDCWEAYDQWGIVYVGPETHGHPVLMGWNGDQYDPEDQHTTLGNPEVVGPGNHPENWTELPKGKNHQTGQGSGHGVQLPSASGWGESDVRPGNDNPYRRRIGAVDVPGMGTKFSDEMVEAQAKVHSRALAAACAEGDWGKAAAIISARVLESYVKALAARPAPQKIGRWEGVSPLLRPKD
jgi:hypothetical protein